MKKKKLNENDIINLLQLDSSLRRCVQKFHHRLAEENDKREASSNRTLLEVSTDALGRLLTGDETCAGVAVDNNKIYVATNKTGHSKKTLDIYLKKITLLSTSTASLRNIRIELEFVINDKRISQFSEISYSPIETEITSFDYKDYKSLLDFSHKLAPKKGSDKINVTLPFSGEENSHGIDEYPYPIDVTLSLGEIPDIPAPLSQDVEVELNKLAMSFSLDPLKRRAEAVFHHLGLIAAYKMKSDLVPESEFKKVIGQHRVRVIQQTLGWEAPVWISGKNKGYALALRQYAMPKEFKSNKEKKQWQERKNNLKQFSDFIDEVTLELNSFLSLRRAIFLKKMQRLSEPLRDAKLKKDLFQAINDWARKKILQLENNNVRNLPNCFIEKPKLAKDFFERAKNYFIDLIHLEDFFESMQDVNFSEILASVGFKNIIRDKFDKTKEGCSFFREDAEIIIVDHLSDGAHAEMRLFKAIWDDERAREEKPIPYFGITMLCCPNCHLFLKSHGIDYVEGKSKRAGKHGKHYADWVFDFSDFEKNIQKFFGDDLFQDYENLEGNLIYGEIEGTKKEWLFSIIEDLAVVDTKALDFSDDKIWSVGSQFSHEEDNLVWKNHQENNPIYSSAARSIQSFFRKKRTKDKLSLDSSNKIDFESESISFLR